MSPKQRQAVITDVTFASIWISLPIAVFAFTAMLDSPLEVPLSVAGPASATAGLAVVAYFHLLMALPRVAVRYIGHPSGWISRLIQRTGYVAGFAIGWAATLAWFAGTTRIAIAQGGDAAPSFGLLCSLYVWHVTDMIPAVNATETLRWAEPMRYTDATVGSFVLVYRFVIVVPLLAGLAWLFKAHDERPGSHDGDSTR